MTATGIVIIAAGVAVIVMARHDRILVRAVGVVIIAAGALLAGAAICDTWTNP